MNLADLRAKAELAWVPMPKGSIRDAIIEQTQAQAAFRDTFDPLTALKLIAVCEAAQALREADKTINQARERGTLHGLMHCAARKTVAEAAFDAALANLDTDTSND